MEKLRIGVEGTQSRSNIHIGPSTPVLIKDQITKEKFFLEALDQKEFVSNF